MSLKLQIKVSEENKNCLHDLKIIEEESFNSVLTRIIKGYKKGKEYNG